MKANNHVFPVDIDFSHNGKYNWGIEVRDYVAIQIATGLSANPELCSRGFDEIADMAYLQADELIKRSNYEPEKKD